MTDLPGVFLSTGARLQYDQDVTTWSPQGRIHQVEYAQEAVKQGSAAIGLKVGGTRPLSCFSPLSVQARLCSRAAAAAADQPLTSALLHRAKRMWSWRRSTAPPLSSARTSGKPSRWMTTWASPCRASSQTGAACAATCGTSASTTGVPGPCVALACV